MPAIQFIPAGRTSEAMRRGVTLQVQTEYASRPSPRITTTILRGGQVLRKIEKPVERQIESYEDQERAEKAIKIQHFEILRLIEDESSELSSKVARSDTSGKDGIAE